MAMTQNLKHWAEENYLPLHEALAAAAAQYWQEALDAQVRGAHREEVLALGDVAQTWQDLAHRAIAQLRRSRDTGARFSAA